MEIPRWSIPRGRRRTLLNFVSVVVSVIPQESFYMISWGISFFFKNVNSSDEKLLPVFPHFLYLRGD